MDLSESLSIDEIRALYKSVVIHAVQSATYGKDKDRDEVAGWIDRPEFEYCAECSGWDGAWLKSIIESCLVLPQSVRKPVARELLDVMRALARVSRDRGPDTYEPNLRHNPESHGTFSAARQGTLDRFQISRLSLASRAMHDRKNS